MDVGKVHLLDNEQRLEACVRSPIKKGKQTSLPSNSKGINQSKFEHNGKDAPLVVCRRAELSFLKFSKL